jgi:protein TonB
LKEDTFKWDVALVETVKTDSMPERSEQAVKPAQTVARVAPPPVAPAPETVVHRVAPQQTVEMVHPVIEPVKPVEQKVEPPPQVEQKLKMPQPTAEPIEQKVVEATQKAEPLKQKAEPPQQKVEPLEQKLVEAATSRIESIEQKAEVQQLKPEPMVGAKEPEPVTHASAPAPSQEVPVQEAAVSRPTAAPLPAAAPPPGSAVTEAPVQIAKAVAAAQAIKVDHRWIAESLGQRLAELKRYPSEARMNRLEGKVILKAVIRSDGHLADVSVQKSSGHSVLDEAAMEAVRLACPLHMKHDIGRPLIVVNVPMVYSLAN